MIELAVSAGVMVACLAGTVQFGYTFYIYNQLVTAVGNGGRYAAMRTLPGRRRRATSKKAKPRSATWWRTAMRVPRRTRCPRCANLKPDQVQVDWVMDESGKPASVNVSIVDYTVDAAFGMFRFTGRPAVEYPFVGRFAPAETEP